MHFTCSKFREFPFLFIFFNELPLQARDGYQRGNNSVKLGCRARCRELSNMLSVEFRLRGGSPQFCGDGDAVSNAKSSDAYSKELQDSRKLAGMSDLSDSAKTSSQPQNNAGDDTLPAHPEKSNAPSCNSTEMANNNTWASTAHRSHSNRSQSHLGFPFITGVQNGSQHSKVSLVGSGDLRPMCSRGSCRRTPTHGACFMIPDCILKKPHVNISHFHAFSAHTCRNRKLF
jgi:hypothetical protein